MNQFSLISSFASYILSDKLSDFVELFIERAKGYGCKFEDLIPSGLNVDSVATLKNESRKLLEAIESGNGNEYIINEVENWKTNDRGIARNYEGVALLVKVINIRKFTFIKILREYTQDVEQREQITLELVEFYSFYFLKLIEAFSIIEQEKILQEKEFTQSIVNNSVHGISAYDLDFNILEWNPVVEKTMGLKREEVIGKNYFDLFPQFKRTEEAELFEKALKGEQVNLYDKEFRTRKGWYDAHFVPLFNTKKEVIGALSITYDVTQRKEAEIKIREDQHFIQTLADSSPDVITVYDLEKNQNIYSSKEIFQILGYNREELQALIDKGIQGLVETIHPDDLQVVLSFLESYKTYTENNPRDLEYRIKDHKGEYRWILDRYNVLKRSKEGYPTQIIGIARDNSLRKHAEEKLSEYAKEIEAANEELRAANETISAYSRELEKARDYYIGILNDFPALIWRADIFAKCDYFNNEWLKYTGRTMAQELGDGWTEGVHPDDVEMCFQTFTTSFRDRTPFVIEYRFRRFDGQYRWIIDIARPLYNLENEFIGFLGACFDIHDKKEFEKEIHGKNLELAQALEELQSAEENLIKLNNELEERVALRTTELSETNKELIKINSDLDNFIYTASHDLKAPILNIEGLTNALDKKLSSKLEAPEKDLMQMIRVSIDRFKRTIIDLTEISKVQKNIDNYKEDVGFKLIIDNVKGEIQTLIDEAGDVTITEDLQVQQINFVERNLRSIIYNLLSNAIKYRAANRDLIINICTYKEDGNVVLAIKDNGLGIEQSQITKIFDMFKRLHHHTEGTGVGLYILKRIIENNNGRIEVESSVNKGSTFKVYFPE